MSKASGSCPKVDELAVEDGELKKLATSGPDNFNRNQSTEGSSQFTAFQWHSNHASAAFNRIY
jgi:hypothetical protein